MNADRELVTQAPMTVFCDGTFFACTEEMEKENETRTGSGPVTIVESTFVCPGCGKIRAFTHHEYETP